MKICKMCLTSKPVDSFAKNKQTKDGLQTRCRECTSLIKAEDYRKKWFKYQVRLKRAECKRKNLPFDLTESYLESIWTDYCPVFGTPFTRYNKKLDSSPSLDRIIPEKGYVKGNVAYISARANRIKYDATVEELMQVLDYLEGATTISKESTLK